jgi:uroporphyrinogen decarboxylase
MSNEKFQNAVKRVAQAVPPIWFMRQAGRYHKHYQNLRAKHSFMDLCKIPELACEVTLGPIQDFDFDVAILFSDLLFPLEGLGMGLNYDKGGPQLGWHLNDETFKDLRSPDEAVEAVLFQKQAMKLARQALPSNKSLIGFVGGPWTLFTYAAQGSHDGSLTEAKRLLHLVPRFCEKLIPLLHKNIALQFEGGAEIVMVFDTSAGELSPALYQQYVVPELAKLAQKFPGKLGYYSRGTQRAHLDHDLFTSGLFAGLGLDHRWPMASTIKQNQKGFIQGNFDQALLFQEPSEFRKSLDAYLEPIKALSLKERAGWVCGLGHGVLPKTPEYNVKAFIERVREVFS